MTLSKMITKITIRKTPSLDRLHERCKGPIDKVIQDLLDRLTNIKGVYLGDTELCGMMLPDILHNAGSTLTSFVNDNYGSATFELLETMSAIQIWGIDGGCDECGCEMEYPGLFNSNYSKCENCGNENFEFSYDPDQFRDDCQAELKTFSPN